MNPGFLILGACVMVAVQIGISWACCRWSCRALEDRMAERIDELAAVIRQQADKEAALVRRAEETLSAAMLALARVDERELARPKSELE